MNLGINQLNLSKKLSDYILKKNLFSHIIGQIDNDNNGISGLEKSLDEKLKNI